MTRPDIDTMARRRIQLAIVDSIRQQAIITIETTDPTEGESLAVVLAAAASDSTQHATGDARGRLLVTEGWGREWRVHVHQRITCNRGFRR